MSCMVTNAVISSAEELEELFESVKQEVHEREAFMQQMELLGRPKAEYSHVRLEIAQRLKELERLDSWIQVEQQP
jgi:hypothetical protein